MIGSLLYLTFSQPNIVYVVGICARFQSDPHTSHLEVVKRIIKYVHGTSDFGILYSYDTNSILVGYCDSDWRGSTMTGKAPLKDVSFFRNNLISWLANVSTRLRKLVPNDVNSQNPTTNAEHEPSAPKIHMFDMNSNDLDDVRLARLLKKTSVPNVAVGNSIDSSVSSHSQESSSTEGVFVPTPGLQHTSNFKLGPSLYSSPVRSSVPDTTTSRPNNNSAPAPADESATTEGRTDVHNDEDEIIEPANTGNHTGEIPFDDNNNPTAQPETHAFPEESRPAKKSQKNAKYYYQNWKKEDPS
ncbi:putative mitochondrial protein [Cucumis melo var. makuwa]|uniref:Putative mitochondrial protein n=1 Tax=Cucumis melo var. makuwa TaxID=1194695 RepID=A0A5D3C3N6_CUCMM|nr:putative mitochondrial protein [Cucumis melo var. makuwa]